MNTASTTRDADPSTEFIKQFTHTETQDRLRQRPVPLSADEHTALRKELETVRFIQPKLADESKINISPLRAHDDILLLTFDTNRYCEEQQWGDWRAALKSVTRATTMSFFFRVCEWSAGAIKSWGTTQVYFRQFQQLYTCVTGSYMNRNDMKELYKFHHRVLIPRFELQAPNTKGKPVLAADSLHAILMFNIAYDAGIFRSEGQRIQLAGCYQLLCYTGARPAEIVDAERQESKTEKDAKHNDSNNVAHDESPSLVTNLLLQETVGRGRPKALCYEDIHMMIVRHPVTGRATPAMAIKFIHHKGADNKPKPTVFFFTPAKKLIFCAVSTVIALALRDQAFDAPSLTNATAILRTRVHGPVQSIALRWKQSMLKTPLFRKYYDAELSMDEAMTYYKLRDDMQRQSLDAGFEKAWTPRFARRGAANAADGNASDSVRDQMMRHDPKFATFHSAYLNENVNFDLQNTFLEEKTEKQLYKVFAHVSLTRDPRVTKDMVPREVWDNLPDDPQILELEQQRRALKGGRSRVQGMPHEAEIRQLTEMIHTKQDQRHKKVVEAYRRYYFYNSPTWDIERQARGDEEEEYAEPAIELAIPERARLAQILCHQPTDYTYNESPELWIEAVDLMVTLFGRRETRRRTCIRTSHRPQPHTDLHSRPKLIPLILEPNQCPDCVGDERLTIEERTFKYCRPTVRNDHFDDQHLKERERTVQRGGVIQCNHPECRDKPQFQRMDSLDAFRHHVKAKHGVSLRTAEQATQRRIKKTRQRKMASQESA
ncbi:FluG domain-containing protein [Colletotrichum cereale]|nr:FluG domain-containing protein [Colletotrichum cereale]